MQRLCGVLVLALALCACGGDSEPEDSANNASNNNASNNNAVNNNNTSNNNRPDMQVTQPDQAPAAPEWAGNWSVSMEYNVTCSSPLQNDRSGDVSGSWTVQISEVSGGLEAQIGPNHYMEGTGSARLLTLSGAFPLQGVQKDRPGSIVRADNQITIRLNEIISANRAQGVVSGTFETGDFTYAKCRINSGTVVFER